jgi:D-alanyl-D-alanine dipeptidase
MNKRLLEHTKDDLGIIPESIPIVENSEPLVALINSRRLGTQPIWRQSPRSIEGRMYKQYVREHPSYQHIYVRKTVAEMLQKAAKSLPSNWKLVVVAGHRPLEVQQSLYNYVYGKLRAKHPPKLADDAVATMTRMYVADPARKSPPHCCGSAVDVNVLDTKTNLLVDFGSPINTDSNKSHIHNPRIPATPYKNRLMLLSAMLDAGFSSLHSEWWHFSYGDQNWAAFYNHPTAIYGIKDVKE